MRKLNVFLIAFCLLHFTFCISSTSWAALNVGEDLEKPRPEFTRDGKIISAKFIPRAKSTSVRIDFEVSGGTLLDVKPLDFKTAARPEIDGKDFRSELFMIEIGEIPRGSEAIVTLRSSFFTSSTQLWIFNERSQAPWINSGAENVALPERARELVIKVKDGGLFDSDGEANGKIFLVVAPWDSFWGYVVGTLFIRFFGVFIVLSALMGGLMLSGFIFQSAEKKAAKIAQKIVSESISLKPVEKPAEPEIKSAELEVSPEIAAVIGLALEMDFSAQQASESLNLSAPVISTWTQQGRSRTMGDRFLTFNRRNR